MTQRTFAFLTMEDTAAWSIDADLAFPPLAALGWDCRWLPWRTPGVDWDAYDAVYPAATWDYPEDPAAFLGVMEAIERSSAVLVNDIRLLRWNLPKTYLRDLASRGADVVPSRWYERFADCDLEADAARFGSERLVVKPVVSTNATDTFLLSLPLAAGDREGLAASFAERPFLVQPFVESVKSLGEYSLFFIGGAYSHAIQKVPKRGDFRVQEEHGAEIRPAAPDAELSAAADRVMRLVEPRPVYARCDFLRGDGRYRLMELELIEPSLYLRMDDRAPSRFAAALDRHVSTVCGD